jgi:hypothetical protein
MLLKYRNSAVQAVSISQTLTKMPALGERKNRPVAEKKSVSNERLEESALINFFRQIVRKNPPGAKINQCGIIVPIRPPAGKPDMRQSPASALTNIYKYRSKASVTCYDLPAIAVNQ